MRFRPDVFAAALKAYGSVLGVMLITSWSGEFALALQGTNAAAETRRIEIVDIAKDWMRWETESVIEWLARWIVVLPLLALCCLLCAAVAVAKIALWFAGLFPAILVCMFLAIERLPEAV